MSERVYVKPAPGFRMRDEVTRRRIPPEGYETHLSSLTIRRMMTRVGGTDESPVFELNKCERPKPVEEVAPVKRKHNSDSAEKAEG